MKNQYFGDISDYRKYGLIRILTDFGRLPTGICWMLTNNDSGKDGRHIGYLGAPDRWRHFDPDLFDTLHRQVMRDGIRDVGGAQDSNVLPTMNFHRDVLCDDLVSRERYFNTANKLFHDRDLIFFDPDNGTEVRSVGKGRKTSSKYLYWDEIRQFYGYGHSLLIYQHNRRGQGKQQMLEEIALSLQKQIGPPAIYVFIANRVAFFLVTQPPHEPFFRSMLDNLSKQWKGQIEHRVYT